MVTLADILTLAVAVYVITFGIPALASYISMGRKW